MYLNVHKTIQQFPDWLPIADLACPRPSCLVWLPKPSVPDWDSCSCGCLANLPYNLDSWPPVCLLLHSPSAYLIIHSALDLFPTPKSPVPTRGPIPPTIGCSSHLWFHSTLYCARTLHKHPTSAVLCCILVLNMPLTTCPSFVCK